VGGSGDGVASQALDAVDSPEVHVAAAPRPQSNSSRMAGEVLYTKREAWRPEKNHSRQLSSRTIHSKRDVPPRSTDLDLFGSGPSLEHVVGRCQNKVCEIDWLGVISGISGMAFAISQHRFSAHNGLRARELWTLEATVACGDGLLLLLCIASFEKQI
jgi:hypothetical protein